MDRLAQENKTSQDKSSDAAIEALYAVISGYNGVIRTIIERTEPVKGKWSTRKSVDQSTVMYLAEVLKGLVEPLKHLEFQLNQVHDPDLASLQGMINNLVNIIDDSPPFKMLDVEKYKFGIPNYEGLSDDLNITNGKGYLALVKAKLKLINQKIDNMKRVIRPGKKSGEISKKLMDHAEKLRDGLEKEVIKARHLVNAKLNDVIINSIISEVDELADAFDEFELPEPMGVKDNNTGRLIPSRVNTFAMETLITALSQEPSRKKLKDRKNELMKQKEAVEKAYGNLVIDGVFDAQSIPVDGHKQSYLKILQEISRLNRSLGIEDEKPKASKSAAPAPQAASPEEAPPPPEEAPPPPEEAPPAPDVGKGAGRPLADLLANPKQQYNYMQRPISDDQKIQNDMINANRNWQIKNNGPHDTPLGNLNPFLSQDDASKYSYQVLLAAKNEQEHPETNALGADISLLQGPIANIEGSGKKSKALLRLKEVAVDEKNDLYKKVDLAPNGMIPEEKEDQFKLPDLKPKKRK